MVILGANLLLSVDDVKSCDQLIKSAKIVITNLEIPVETAFESLKLAKKNNGFNFLSNFDQLIKFSNILLISYNCFEFCSCN